MKNNVSCARKLNKGSIIPLGQRSVVRLTYCQLTCVMRIGLRCEAKLMRRHQGYSVYHIHAFWREILKLSVGII